MSKKQQANVRTDIGLSPDPALLENGKRWFAEARAQTERDEQEITAWLDRHAAHFDETGERLPRRRMKALDV